MTFVTVIKRQNKLMWLPKKLVMNGMLTSQLTIASGADKSLAHKNDYPLNSMHDGKNENIATRIGNCNNIGRQPLIGLAPAELYNAIIFC